MPSVGELLGFSKAKTRAPDILAQENLLTQITPTGTLRVGSIDREGTFVPGEQIAATRIEETPFQEEFRTGREALSLDLLGQQSATLPEVRGVSDLGAFPTITGGSSSIVPRTAQEIRGIVPSAQGTTEGLGDIRTATSIAGGASPLVRSDQFGSEIERLERSTFEGVKRRLDPGFRKREERLLQNLADRGIPRDSRAGQFEIQQLRQDEDEALTRASLDSVQAGRGEQERLARLGLATRGQEIGEGLSLAGLESSTRGQEFGENRAQLSDALQKQLQLSGLESSQRGQQFGEDFALSGLELQARQQQLNEELALRGVSAEDRQRALNELGGAIGLGSQFGGSIVQTGAGTIAEANRLSAGATQAARLGDTLSTAAGIAGGGGFGSTASSVFGGFA